MPEHDYSVARLGSTVTDKEADKQNISYVAHDGEFGYAPNDYLGIVGTVGGQLLFAFSRQDFSFDDGYYPDATCRLINGDFIGCNLVLESQIIEFSLLDIAKLDIHYSQNYDNVVSYEGVDPYRVIERIMKYGIAQRKNPDSAKRSCSSGGDFMLGIGIGLLF